MTNTAFETSLVRLKELLRSREEEQAGLIRAERLAKISKGRSLELAADDIKRTAGRLNGIDAELKEVCGRIAGQEVSHG